MKPLTFSFMIDPREQVRVNRLVNRRTRIWKVSQVLAVIFGVLVAGMFLVFEGTRTFLVPALAGLAVWLLWDALTPRFERWQVRRALARLPSLQEPQAYMFDADGLQMRNSLASGTISWAAIVKAVETDEYFLLYYTDRCAYYLPKRVVGEHASELRELLASQLGTGRLELLPEGAVAPVT